MDYRSASSLVYNGCPMTRHGLSEIQHDYRFASPEFSLLQARMNACIGAKTAKGRYHYSTRYVVSLYLRWWYKQLHGCVAAAVTNNLRRMATEDGYF